MALRAAYGAFLIDRKAARCTYKTLEHYTYTVGSSVAWLRDSGVSYVDEITPGHIRAYLISLQDRNLKDTTQHAHARGIKAWLNWLVREGDLETSPMANVTMPKLAKRVLPPFTPRGIQRLLAQCDRKTAIGRRNYAIILTLLDTGLRASELVSLRIGDLDVRSGMVTVFGKGQKQRQVRVGRRARGAILRMLKSRTDTGTDAPMWIAYDAKRRELGPLSAWGLRSMLKRAGRTVGLLPCSAHRFRRTFALWCLRDGMDLHSLRVLMGHSSLDVLQRYLALTTGNIQKAHMAHSPADRFLSQSE